jgi:hypothetical protein
MNSARRLMLVLLVVLLGSLALALVGCGASKSIIGAWYSPSLSGDPAKFDTNGYTTFMRSMTTPVKYRQIDDTSVEIENPQGQTSLWVITWESNDIIKFSEGSADGGRYYMMGRVGTNGEYDVSDPRNPDRQKKRP